MKKFLNFVLIIFASSFIAGIYGIIHDQVTYTISNEYYTLFKFEQFRINEWGISNVRTKVGIIGFLATWWVGLILGIVYAVISLFFNPNKVLKVSLKSILLNIGVTIFFGILGFIYGALYLKAENLNWYIPEHTKNIQDFVNVGSTHNFSYLGGILGLFVGLYYQIKNSKKNVE